MSSAPPTRFRRPLAGALLALVIGLMLGGAWWWRSRNIVVQVERMGGTFVVHQWPTNPFDRLGRWFNGVPLSDSHQILFWHSRVDDEWLRVHRDRLAELTDLDLQIGNTAITDRGLKHLAGLQNIVGLSVYETGITDDGMPALATMTNMWHLELSRTQVGGAGLQQVLSLPHLERLQIAGTEITDDDLALLADAPMLNSVVIGASQATERGIANLFACPKLNGSLTIMDADDETVIRLAAWPELRTLLVHGHSVTDASVPALTTLQGLEVLTLMHTSVTEKGRRQLEEALPNCRLALRETPQPPAQLK